MDDNVLVAAGDEEFAVRDIGQITRIQPDPIEQFFCLVRRPQIAAGSGGSLELQVPLLAVGQFTPGIVNYSYLMARQRHATANKLQRIGIALGGRRGAASIHQRRAPDMIDPGNPIYGRESQTHAALGQAIDRKHGLRPEADSSEAVDETLQCRWTDRLGPVRRNPPGRKVHSRQILILDPLEAKLVGEIRRRRYCAAITVYGPKPALRPGEIIQGRHDDQVDGVIETAEPGPDQSHVVIKRQPTDKHVIRCHLKRLAHGADIG